MRRPRVVLAMVVTLALMAGGCPRPVSPIHKVETRRSREHRLLVRNDTHGPLRVLSAAGSTGPPLELSPGTTVSLAFRVVRLVDLEPSGHGWFRRREGAISYVVVPGEPIRYVGTAGVDAAVLVESPDGMRWKFLIELGECWFRQSIAAERRLLAIAGPPEAGIPAVPCP